MEFFDFFPWNLIVINDIWMCELYKLRESEKNYFPGFFVQSNCSNRTKKTVAVVCRCIFKKVISDTFFSMDQAFFANSIYTLLVSVCMKSLYI